MQRAHSKVAGPNAPNSLLRLHPTTLQTVLDDNKVLTLANGDRILMTPAMKVGWHARRDAMVLAHFCAVTKPWSSASHTTTCACHRNDTKVNSLPCPLHPPLQAMFEPENLANASPATVSRAGIIYVSDSELGWQPVVASWLQVGGWAGCGWAGGACCGSWEVTSAVDDARFSRLWTEPPPHPPSLAQSRPEREAAALRPCFDKYVGPLLDFVRLELRPVMHNEQVCQVQTLLTLLTGVLKPLASGSSGGSGSGSGSSGSSAPLSHDHYERLFLYCATWSLGGLLDAKERPRFDAHLRSLTDQAPEKVGAG